MHNSRWVLVSQWRRSKRGNGKRGTMKNAEIKKNAGLKNWRLNHVSCADICQSSLERERQRTFFTTTAGDWSYWAGLHCCQVVSFHNVQRSVFYCQRNHRKTKFAAHWTSATYACCRRVSRTIFVLILPPIAATFSTSFIAGRPVLTVRPLGHRTSVEGGKIHHPHRPLASGVRATTPHVDRRRHNMPSVAVTTLWRHRDVTVLSSSQRSDLTWPNSCNALLD